MSVELPLLFVDIDGVLNPYAAPACPSGFHEYDLFPGEEPVRLSFGHRDWLVQLGEHFELVWASAWNEGERARLSARLGLPAFSSAVRLPAAPFDPRLKVAAVDRVAGSRHAAWVDDMLTEEAWAWAAGRTAATLLLAVDPATGLARSQVDVLLEWSESLG